MVLNSSVCFTLIHGLLRTPIIEHGTVSDSAFVPLGIWGSEGFREDGFEKVRQTLFFSSTDPLIICLKLTEC